MTTPEGFTSGDDEEFQDSSDKTATDIVQSNSAWVPDDALAALVTERQIHPEETEEQTARRLMIENVGAVTMSIINIAMHGSTERTRLDAGKYLMDRVLGKPGDDAFGGTRSPAELLIESVTEFVHSHDGVGDTSSPDASNGASGLQS